MESIQNNMKKLSAKIEQEFSSQIVGCYNDSDSVSVALVSNDDLNQDQIDQVEAFCQSYSKEAFKKGYVNKAAHYSGYDVYEARGTHWDELENDSNPDGIALTITFEAGIVFEDALQDATELFMNLIELCTKEFNMNESTRRLNEGAFAEIDTAIQDYIQHVKQYDAPVSIDDCIDFVADVCDMDLSTLEDMEAQNGYISNLLGEYLQESRTIKHKHLIKEAKKYLEKRGYIVK